MSLYKVLAAWVFFCSSQFLMVKFVAFTDVIASTAVKMETTQISEMVYLDSLDESAPSPDAFSNYLRKNMITKLSGRAGHRDYSKDYWGSPYKLEVQPGVIKIASAGPDMIFGTDDDIVSGLQVPERIPSGPVIDPLQEFKEPVLHPEKPVLLTQKGVDPRLFKGGKNLTSTKVTVIAASHPQRPLKPRVNHPMTPKRLVAQAKPVRKPFWKQTTPAVADYSFEIQFAYQVSYWVGWARQQYYELTRILLEDDRNAPTRIDVAER